MSARLEALDAHQKLLKKLINRLKSRKLLLNFTLKSGIPGSVRNRGMWWTI